MKSQGQEGGDCIRVHLCVHGALWGPCVYMQSVCGRGRVFEWRIKGPHVHGLRGADSWPIKRGPPKAEWKNEIGKKLKKQKHPHQRKRQPWGFLKCSAATAPAWGKKGPTSASNTPQILGQQWAFTKGGAESRGSREGAVGGEVGGGKDGGKDGGMERWREQACVLHFPIASLSCLSSLHPVSN